MLDRDWVVRKDEARVGRRERGKVRRMLLDTRIVGGMEVDREYIKQGESNEFTHWRQTANDDGMYHCRCIAVPEAESRLGHTKSEAITALAEQMHKQRPFLRPVIPLRSNSTANAQIINREPLREANRPAQRIQQFHRHGCGVIVEDTPCRADGQSD
jgi:hypothetical protein